jgi:hypothetical protein
MVHQHAHQQQIPQHHHQHQQHMMVPQQFGYAIAPSQPTGKFLVDPTTGQQFFVAGPQPAMQYVPVFCNTAVPPSSQPIYFPAQTTGKFLVPISAHWINQCPLDQIQGISFQLPCLCSTSTSSKPSHNKTMLLLLLLKIIVVLRDRDNMLLLITLTNRLFLTCLLMPIIDLPSTEWKLLRAQHQAFMKIHK